MDELSTKVTELERESKTLRRMADRNRDHSSKVRELEKENLDLARHVSTDKQALSTLREVRTGSCCEGVSLNM